MCKFNVLGIETSADVCSVALHYKDELTWAHEVVERQQASLLLPMIERLLGQSALTLKQLDAIAFSCGPGSFTGVRLAVSVAQGLAYGSGLPVVSVSSLQVLAQGVVTESMATAATSISPKNIPSKNICTENTPSKNVRQENILRENIYMQNISPKNISPKNILVVTDAYVNEVYCGAYRYDYSGYDCSELNNLGYVQVMIPDRRCKPNEINLSIFGDINASSEGYVFSETSWVGVGNGWSIYSEILQAEILRQRIPKIIEINASLHPHARDLVYLARKKMEAGEFLLPESATPNYLYDAGRWGQ